MTVWWHSDQVRLQHEKAAIAALEVEADWLENVEWSLDDLFRLRVVFDIRFDHGRFRLQMIYHYTFPSSPPGVSPVEDICLSDHQYGAGGDLCLGIRPDNWRPDYTGADMIRNAHDLFTEETPDEEGVVTPAPSAHDVPAVLGLRTARSRLYLSAATQLILLTRAPDRATVKIGLHWCGNDYIVAHLHGLEKDDWTWCPPGTPPALGAEAYNVKGALIHAELDRASLADVTTAGSLITAIGAEDVLSGEVWACLVVVKDGGVTFFRKTAGDATLICYQTVLQPFETDRRSGEEYAGLSEKRVGIVGLGSLGSKIAVSLARAGVDRFELVDGDILHGGNLERHDADWRDVGLHKANLAARRLRLVAPGVQCEPWRTAIGAQVSTREAGNVNAALDGCDLIVDATANPDVFNHLAGLVCRSNATLVWGGVYTGGIGGEIGRSRPRKDPDPFLIRDAVNRFYATVEDPPPVAAGRGYVGSENDEMLTATDADIATIAAHVVALALDALIDREPSRYDAHAYLIGHTRAWMFKAPFHVQPIIADAPLRTDLSPPGEAGVEKEFLDTLIKTKFDEITDRTKDG